MERVLLRLLQPDSGRLVPCPVSRIGRNGIWSFPVGHQTYQETRAGRQQVLHIPDGVAADTLGVNPPEFRIEATFGANPKTIGGVTYTARELLDDLYDFVVWFYQDRREALRVRRPMIEMAMDDFINDRHWIVLPDAAPQIRRNAREPMRPSFSMTLFAIRPANEPSTRGDNVAQNLSPDRREGVAAVADTAFGSTP